MAEGKASQVQGANPTSEEGESEESPIDIVALTAAVERLLRRDLAIERERLRPGGLA